MKLFSTAFLAATVAFSTVTNAQLEFGQCMEGYSEPNFKGTRYPFVCAQEWRCAELRPEYVDKLLSVRGYGAHPGGVLYTQPGCTGERLAVDQEGWGDLSTAPPYRSFGVA